MISPREWRGDAIKALAMETYRVKAFDLKGLRGISDRQIEAHLELYAGFVRNVNALNEVLAELARDGKAGTPAYGELTRRLGFEYDGMRLHELYFDVYPDEMGFIPAILMVDEQLEHATRASLPSPRFPGEQGWYFDQGEKAGNSPDWFTVAAMVAAGH